MVKYRIADSKWVIFMNGEEGGKYGLFENRGNDIQLTERNAIMLVRDNFPESLWESAGMHIVLAFVTPDDKKFIREYGSGAEVPGSDIDTLVWKLFIEFLNTGQKAGPTADKRYGRRGEDRGRPDMLKPPDIGKCLELWCRKDEDPELQILWQSFRNGLRGRVMLAFPVFDRMCLFLTKSNVCGPVYRTGTDFLLDCEIPGTDDRELIGLLTKAKEYGGRLVPVSRRTYIAEHQRAQTTCEKIRKGFLEEG